jgi:hypothetical protein
MSALPPKADIAQKRTASDTWRWGLYGFAVYALPLLFDLGWQPAANPQILVVRLLAWLGGVIFLGIWGGGLIADLLYHK